MPQSKTVTTNTPAGESIGKNVRATVDGNVLTITVDLNADLGPSKSGKTTLVASTGGFAGFAGVKIGLNVTK